jgi:S-DNA-T family DNA segregation ATPase FtsK/SpoIIIE
MPPTAEQDDTILRILVKLTSLGHDIKFQEPITVGPLITTYRFAPKSSTKVAQIVSCADDLTIALACDQDVMIRRLPGEAVIGISVPNRKRQAVLWRDTLASPNDRVAIPLNMGTDEQGALARDDLTLLPHLLVAGSTGSGKSTWMNSAIASLIYWRPADKLHIALSDTKNVEFTLFDGASHLWCPRATSRYATWEILDELFAEIERRMARFAKLHVRNISENNALARGQPEPYIVLFIDELATVLEGDKRGESKIAQSKIGRIVQLSRAAGIHIVAGTQRPSVDVVVGSIKNNFPARLAFRVASGFDSRTVINQDGAEHLINRGDMLYQSPNQAGVKRLHASLARDEDLKHCLHFVQTTHQPNEPTKEKGQSIQ